MNMYMHHIHAHTYMRTHIHTYIHNTHMHMHTYIHTYIHPCWSAWQPTNQPTNQPINKPTNKPTYQQANQPSKQPINKQTKHHKTNTGAPRTHVFTTAVASNCSSGNSKKNNRLTSPQVIQPASSTASQQADLWETGLAENLICADLLRELSN